jgi:hypothetical protein
MPLHLTRAAGGRIREVCFGLVVRGGVRKAFASKKVALQKKFCAED